MKPISVAPEVVLAPDLEWMLQSNQASPAMLLDVLLIEWLAPVYRLGLASLGTEAAAAQVVEETFSAVLLNRHQFNSQTRAPVWIYRLALAACRTLGGRRDAPAADAPMQPAAFWALPAETRQLMFLHYKAGLPVAEIAALLRAAEATLINRLEAAAVALEPLRHEAAPALEQVVAQALPVPELDEDQHLRLAEVILARLAHRSVRQKRFAALKEALWVFVAIVATLGMLWGVNLLFPEPEDAASLPAQNVIVVTEVVRVYVTSTPQPTPQASPTPAAETAARAGLRSARVDAKPPAPLTARSDPAFVLERMRASRQYWTGVWVDGLVVDYGPPGFTGQPQVQRDQIWVQQPYNSLVLAGKSGEDPDQIWFAVNNKVYDVNLETGRPFFYDFHRGAVPIYSDLADLIFPAQLVEGVYQAEISGSVEIAGRQALILELDGDANRPTRQVWVDAVTGMALGLRQYAPDNHTVERVIIFTRMELNPDFPDDIFDRNALVLQYARDFTGRVELSFHEQPVPNWISAQGRQPLARVSPPSDFDPARQELTFQWSSPDQYNAFAAQYVSRPMAPNDPFFRFIPVDLFAGGYFLGQVELNPWAAVCTRSPDGRAVAVSYSAQVDAESGEARVRPQPVNYISLNDPDERLTTPPEVIPSGALAFSPDGRQLAFSGCSVSTRCGVFLWDLERGDSRFLTAIGDAANLVWSPDGEHLAMTGLLPQPVIFYGLQVVRVADGEVTYAAPYEADGGELPDGAPVTTWDIPFPRPVRSGLSDCVSPPAF